jgi:hypothetical protein
MQLVEIPKQRELWGLSAIILIAALVVAPGFFTLDEAIYHLGARAFAESGKLSIQNGFDQLHSEALKLKILVNGPDGLTPQYPAGSALLGGLLLPLAAARTFFLLNALAGVLALFTVQKICISQFKCESVARIAVALLVLGTFWLEYAAGIWPHALAAYFAIQAYWFVLRHLDDDEGRYRTAMLSGLFAGAGILIRLDAAFAVLAIGLIILIFAPRPVHSAFSFSAGVLPSVALTCWFNFLKFGSANPFSYGQSAGNTQLAAYGPFVAALCAGLGALMVTRMIGWKFDRKAASVSLAVLAVSLLFIPATHAWLLRFWHGLIALGVDVRTIEDHRVGVQRGPEQTLAFWGLAKKSLGQSMPWLGLAAILLTTKIRESDRRVFATLLVFIATMTTPFILLSWHGGSSSNMRYFLPVLPPLCILCARLFSDLWQSVDNAMACAAAGAWAAIGLCTAWVFLRPSGYVGVQQILSTYVLLSTALTAIAAGVNWRFSQIVRDVAIALFACGVMMAMVFAATDFAAAAKRRALNYEIGRVIAELPANSLVIALPSRAAAYLPGNGSLLAMRDTETKRIDPRLIANAIDSGFRVFLTSEDFDAGRDVPPGVEPAPTTFVYPGGCMIELRHQVLQGPAALVRSRFCPAQPASR